MASDSEEVSDFNFNEIICIYKIYLNLNSFIGIKKSFDDEKSWRKRR